MKRKEKEVTVSSKIFAKIDQDRGSARSERQSITLTVGRDRKIKTVQRTNGTLGFVTVPAASYSELPCKPAFAFGP